MWPISPALRWHVEDGSWVVLGFEAVEGRPANFGPDSADLRSIVELVECIGRLKLPPVAEGRPETRWDPFVRNDSEAEFFRGETLLHTDINPSNLLVGESGMCAVDWAWPTRGGRPSSIRPSWFFNWWPPDTVPSLRSRGGAQCTAWAEAEPKALDAFAAAQLRMYSRGAQAGFAVASRHGCGGSVVGRASRRNGGLTVPMPGVPAEGARETAPLSVPATLRRRTGTGSAAQPPAWPRPRSRWCRQR